MGFTSYDFAPQNGSQPSSAVVMLHGVGSNGQDLISLAPMLSEALPNTVFISPDAPFTYDMAVGYPNMFQWFSLADRAPEVMLADLQKAQPLVDEFLDKVCAKYALPASKVALLGFSQGTMTALHIAPRRVEELAAVVGFSGALLAPELLAAQAKTKSPICLVHGVADDVVPFAAMEKAESALTAAGFNVSTHARPNLPHSIDLEGIEIAKKFLAKNLA